MERENEMQKDDIQTLEESAVTVVAVNEENKEDDVIDLEPQEVITEEVKAGEEASDLSKKKKKRVVIAVAAAVIGILGIFFWFESQILDRAGLSQASITVEEGSVAHISLVCEPSTANLKNYDLKWYSSDSDIATINSDGEIEALSGGTCTISLEWDGTVVDTCEVIVESVIPSFDEIYDKLDAPSYATVASDGSYLFLDTNPDDTEDYSDETAIIGLYIVHELLELPESVINEMGQTRAMDGVQSYSNDVVNVKWRYHPDQGLEVTYSWC